MKEEDILFFLKKIKENHSLQNEFRNLVIDNLELRNNAFHPLVFINGNPQIGKNVYIGLFSEVNARGAEIIIGNNCDIASFVSINVADSHLVTLGKSPDIKRESIILGDNVFVGSHTFIGGNVHIDHHCVVGAGSVVINTGYIPPYSLIVGNPAVVKEGYFI